MEAPAKPTSGFFRHELDTALRENGYALMAWEVLGRDDDAGTIGQAACAEARVDLLPESESQGDKGRTVEIQLTLRGYEVKEAGSTSRHYETLDDLLSAISPPYLQRRQRLLFAKLEDVAKDRSWSDQEQPQHDERAEKADSSHST